VVQVGGVAVKCGIILTRIQHSKKTVLYRRVQCDSFNFSSYRKEDVEKEKELYIPQDEQAELIDAWV
jgi:hypothetical protein